MEIVWFDLILIYLLAVRRLMEEATHSMVTAGILDYALKSLHALTSFVEAGNSSVSHLMTMT